MDITKKYPWTVKSMAQNLSMSDVALRQRLIKWKKLGFFPNPQNDKSLAFHPPFGHRNLVLYSNKFFNIIKKINGKAPKSNLVLMSNDTTVKGVWLGQFEPLSEVVAKHVSKVLDFHNGNKVRAAMALGISPKTIYNMLYNNKASKIHSYRSAYSGKIRKGE